MSRYERNNQLNRRLYTCTVSTSWAWLDRLLTGGRVVSLSGICSSATIVVPYQIAAFFTCLVTLPFASSCETAMQYAVVYPRHHVGYHPLEKKNIHGSVT